MPRKAGIQAQNKFIRGLITENTALSFPKDACTETYDCVFDYTGRVTRRLGFDIETDSTPFTVTLDGTEAITEFEWRNVSGDATKTLFVQQIGATVYFFNATSSTDLTPNILATTITLSTYIPSGSTFDPGTLECQYATGNGNLIIVNGYMNPLLVQYDIATGAFTVTTVTIKIRDFEGVDDGLDITDRPTESVASLATNNPEHYYNILNQGWSLTDALTQWDTARTDVPSNADMVGYYRNTETDAFIDTRVTAYDPGNSPAIKGHFILNAGELDRTAALSDAGFTAVALTGNSASLIAFSEGTAFSNATASGTRIFDGSISTTLGAAFNAVTAAYAGKDWGSGNTRTISRAVWHGIESLNDTVNSYTGVVNITLYGSNTAPSSATDGTSLGTSSYTNDAGSMAHSIVANDISTAYRYHWVTIAKSGGGSAIFYCTELQFFSTAASFYRPSTVSFFAGRAWYSGIDTTSESSSVYFSIVIQSDQDYGLCYQKNDPTAEDLGDLLADDGGAIKIPEIGKIIRLFPFQGQMLVFAYNGVWLIKGGSGGFKATDYEVRRITNIGTFSPMSVVDVKGIPVWWAEDGIYTVQYDPNYDSITVRSMTEETIKTFITDIPAVNRQHVKGTFDRIEDFVYWSYNNTASLPSTQHYMYNRVLVLNAKTGAFFPWTISTSGSNSPNLRGLHYIQDGDRADIYLVKYPITYTLGATTYFTYADQRNNEYTDWQDYAVLSTDADDEVDYTSYFITGYAIDAELMNFFQTNYVMVYLEDEDNASCWMRGIWDFASTSASNKWSNQQQTYPPLTTRGRDYRIVKVRRLKVRGKGRAFQMKMSSESGKPFTVVGWGLLESANGTP